MMSNILWITEKECAMANSDDDFDIVIGKVRKHGKDGESLEGAELGTGGRRRDDGTLAALAEDLRVIQPGEEAYSEYVGGGPSNDGSTQNSSASAGNVTVDNDELAALIGGGIALAAALLGVIVVENREEIKGWIGQKILNPLGSIWREIRLRLPRKQQPTEIVVLDIPETSPGDLVSEVQENFQNEQLLMSSQEAKKRYLQIVLAMEFLAREVREYEQAVIIDEQKVLELRNLATLVTSPQGDKILGKLLETEDTTLDAETKTGLFDLLNGALLPALEQRDD
jgi:hypothetical protein